MVKCTECDNLACWGETNSLRCNIHKLLTDINTANKSKKCYFTNCTVCPGYGFEKSRPISCASHKKEGMWAVCNKLCQFEICTKIASYGIEKNNPLKCFEHKDSNYFYVKKKKHCVFNNCNKIPTFGKVNTKKAEYCAEHIPDNTYIDVKHKKCKFNNCKTRPTFGKINTNIADYCVQHIPDDTYVDVLNKRCEYDTCNNYPTHGITPGIALSCLEHKKENYTNSFTESKKILYNKNKNKPIIKIKRKSYYIKHKTIILKKSRYYYNINYTTRLIQRCITRSIKKKLNYDICLDFINFKLEQQQYKCDYCKCDLSLINDVGKRKLNVLSIDRINSHIGYIKGNIHITCMFCNYAKNNFTDKSYKNFVTSLKSNDNSLYKFNHDYNISSKWTNGKITYDWLKTQLEKQNWKCFYSGLDLLPPNGKKSPFQFSIERLNCKLEHTPENCVLICLSLNYGRNNCDLDYFKNHLNNIIKS